MPSSNKQVVNRQGRLKYFGYLVWAGLVTIFAWQSPVHSEENDWLNRSQTLLNALRGRERPAWLEGNPHQFEAREQAREILQAAQQPVTPATSADSPGLEKDGKPLRVVYVSFSLGEFVLKDLLLQASGQNDVLLVFRGPRSGQKIPGLLADLRRLMKDIEPVPKVVIDPTRYQKAGVTTVPEITLEQKGQVLARARGVTQLDWFRERTDAGRTGDLGTFGSIQAIAEIDLLEEIRRRVAAIDWNRKKQEAINRFWENQRFVELPETPEDRERRVDLTVTAPRDLGTADGTVFVHAGEKINPLDRMPFGLCLIVFDAIHKAQVETAKRMGVDLFLL